MAGSKINLSVIPPDFGSSYVADAKFSSRNRRLGMLYLMEGYITHVKVVEEGPGKVAVTGRCYRSMRKGAKPHSMHIVISIPDRTITDSLCSCIAG